MGGLNRRLPLKPSVPVPYCHDVRAVLGERYLRPRGVSLPGRYIRLIVIVIQVGEEGISRIPPIQKILEKITEKRTTIKCSSKTLGERLELSH